MKFSLSWLKTHLDTAADIHTISKALTSVGLEVEKITNKSDGLERFIVGLIVEAKPHPNADKLQVCTVDTGAERLQVVCGAPNARAGLKTAFAGEGSVVPRNGMVLKKTKIRDVESNGMCCSGYELNLTDDHEGIIELPVTAELGVPIAQVLHLDDPVIEISVTPDRADCLGVRGIARDLAAYGLGALRPKEFRAWPGGYESPIGVTLDLGDAAAACPLFLGRYIRNLRNGPSPDWLKQRLESIGLRPISVLVDITNFLTFDLNRPLHVFDAIGIQGNLHVRMSKEGETLSALNGRDYVLDNATTVIADNTGVLSLGGIIGGVSSSVSEATTDVFLEAALFDPLRTARTGRKLQINSDARFRFERGIDPGGVFDGIEEATHLILQLCGGEISDVVVAGAVPDTTRAIGFRPARVAELGGVDVAPTEARRILTSLGFTGEMMDEQWSVVPPSWRGDVGGEACVVEEVLRIYGYDKIPVVAPARTTALPSLAVTSTQARTSQLRRFLASRGMTEAVTWSFMSRAQAELFGGGDEKLRLVNAISSDLDQMRPTPLHNLVSAAVRNAARGIDDIALFEIGPGYLDDTANGQVLIAAGFRAGQRSERSWRHAAGAVDAFDAKADAFAILSFLGISPDSVQIERSAPAWYHPGRSGALKLGPKVVLGYFGALHPKVQAALDLDAPAAAFELFLDAVPLPKPKSGRARPKLNLASLQPVRRDFAFLIGDTVPMASLIKAARSADPALISDIKLFDVYRGKGLPEATISIAIAVTLQPTDHTLTDAEIEAVSTKLVDAVTKATGGSLRA
jgi:phenylalanyl-tRNA synthetase beta chain